MDARLSCVLVFCGHRIRVKICKMQTNAKVISSFTNCTQNFRIQLGFYQNTRTQAPPQNYKKTRIIRLRKSFHSHFVVGFSQNKRLWPSKLFVDTHFLLPAKYEHLSFRYARLSKFPNANFIARLHGGQCKVTTTNTRVTKVWQKLNSHQ